MRDRYIGDNVYIRPNYIALIPEIEKPPITYVRPSTESKKEMPDNTRTEHMSKKSSMKVKNSINWQVASAKRIRVWSKEQSKHFHFKLAMITLTLPVTEHDITDHQFKEKMLHRFIQWLRKQKRVRSYVWVVEAQENGNIHAHITVNQFIHHADIRREWNGILEDMGLMDLYRSKTGKENPPSTEIKAIRKVKNLAGYLATYLTKKQDNKRMIKGRVWGSSYNLSIKNKLCCFADRMDTDAILSGIDWKRAKVKTIESVNSVTGEVFEVGKMVLLKYNDWGKIVTGHLEQIYRQHLSMIRNSFEQLPIEYYSI